MAWRKKDDAPLGERIARINSILKGCRRICFFGGAGVSTKSGIPDFRSAGGMYRNPDPEFRQYRPEYLLSRECLEDEPEVFYRFYRKKMDMRGYEPNVIHRRLAELEADGRMTGVITQNIDGLHEAAGTKRIAKIHGTAASCFCAGCGKECDPGRLFADTDGPVPRCACGGMLRPGVVLYGEMLPAGEIEKAHRFLAEADCLIVCGTSVALPHIRNMIRSYTGTYLIVLNGTETPFDGYADVTCHEDIFDIFGKVRWK